MQFIFKTIYWLLILALLGIGLLLMATMVPIPGNIEVKIVKSGSMEPTITTGSVVVIKPESTYTVGDVITFGADTKRQIPTTHRIVEVVEENGKRAFITKGDANETADPQPTLESQVIGKVLQAVPRAGFVLDFARTTLGFALLVGVPAGLIILDELVKIGSEVKRYLVRRRGNNVEALLRKNAEEKERSKKAVTYLHKEEVSARPAVSHVPEAMLRPRRFLDESREKSLRAPKVMDGIVVIRKSHAQG